MLPVSASPRGLPHRATPALVHASMRESGGKESRSRIEKKPVGDVWMQVGWGWGWGLGIGRVWERASSSSN